MSFSYEEVVEPAAGFGFADPIMEKTATGFTVAMSRGGLVLMCHSDVLVERNFARLQRGCAVVSHLDGSLTCEPDTYRAWLAEKRRAQRCAHGGS